METQAVEATYSQIISAENYNRIITQEHLYIATADKILVNIVKTKAENAESISEVVEVGCGPGRILPLLAKIKNINLTGIDHDPSFIKYAGQITAGLPLKVKIADIETYTHNEPVDIFCSMGVHHHISPGEHTNKYLKNILTQLKPGGYYIIGDEFLPNYTNEAEREICLVIWYSHIIADAIKHKYHYLATEEAKTLLDDLETGRHSNTVKTNEQIEFVLSQVTTIDTAARNNDIQNTKLLATEFLQKLNQMCNVNIQGEEALALSRGDYKICDAMLREEANQAGFLVENVQSVGPIKNIGAMCVYTLKKPE